MKSKIILLAVCATLMVGCSKYQKKHHHKAHAKAEPVVSVNTDYQDGFHHGCKSGLHYDNTEIAVKDFHRRAHSPAYSMGWDDGFTECRYNPYLKHEPKYHTVY